MFDIFSKENYFNSKVEKLDENEEEKENEDKVIHENTNETNIDNYQEIFKTQGIQFFGDNDITFKITGLDSCVQYDIENENNNYKENEENEENEEVDEIEENEYEGDEFEEENDIDEDSEDDEDKIYLLLLNNTPYSYFLNKKEAQENILSFARTINLNENKDFPDSYIIEHTRNEIKVIRVFDFIFFKYHHILKHFKLMRIYKF